MKNMFAVAVAIAAMAVYAEEEYISPVTGKPMPKDAKYTLEQFKARDERVLKKTGGFLLQKAEGPLAMLIDARAKATATVDEVARLYKLGTHLDINVGKTPRGTADALEFAQTKMASDKPLMLVVVVEKCPKLPTLSVYPEERIGLVNADRLLGGNDPTVPEMRIAKEIWRAMGFIGGVGFSQADNDMMQPYYTLAEIDANTHPYIQPMNMAKMYKFWKRFGVKKEARIPYKVAAQQGWAPPPTNEYQKAAWDEVKNKKTDAADPTNRWKRDFPEKK